MKRLVFVAVAGLAVMVAAIAGMTSASAATTNVQVANAGVNLYNATFSFSTDELPVSFRATPQSGFNPAVATLSFVSCSHVVLACGPLTDSDPAADVFRIDSISGIDGDLVGQPMTVTIGVNLSCSVPASTLLTGTQNDPGLTVALPCTPGGGAVVCPFGNCGVPCSVYGCNVCGISMACNPCGVYACGNIHPCTNAYSPQCGGNVNVCGFQACNVCNNFACNNCGAYACNPNCGLYGCTQGCNCGYYSGVPANIYISTGVTYKGAGLGALFSAGQAQYTPPAPQPARPPAPQLLPPPQVFAPSTGEGAEAWTPPEDEGYYYDTYVE